VKITWTPEAERDRDEICAYIASDDPDAAADMDDLFSDAAARLVDFPGLGHPGEIAGTRELTAHPNYRLIYDIAGETIRILALVHAARRWPPARS
jgi:addiction module RelE/StbE family toxin